jgi:hypothetical protein
LCAVRKPQQPGRLFYRFKHTLKSALHFYKPGT